MDGSLSQLPAVEAIELQRLRALTQLDLGNPELARASLNAAQSRLAHLRSAPDADRLRTQLELVEASVLSAEGAPVRTLELLAALYRHTNTTPNDPLSLQVAEAYASQLDGMDRREAAAAINQEILQSLPDPDNDVLGRRVLGNLTRWHRGQGNQVAALEYADRYLAATSRLYGEHHRQYASALDLHARTLADAGDLDLADQQFQDSLAVLQALGSQVPARALCIAKNNYADFLLHRRKQPDRAYRESSESLALARTAYPAGHLNIAFFAKLVGESLLAMGRGADAYKHLAEAEAIYADFAGPEVHGLTRAQTQLLLAQAAHTQGNMTKARFWLMRAMPILSASQDPEILATADRLERALKLKL